MTRKDIKRKIKNIVPWLKRKLRIVLKLLYLKARFHLNRGRLNIDYGCIILPFNNDGDWQEIGYHLYGRDLCPIEGLPFSKYLRKGDQVIDVGANMGIFAAIFSKIVGDEGNVFCFEPSKRSFEKAKVLKKLNRLTNLELHNLGCSASSGNGVIYFAERLSGTASLVPKDCNKPKLKHENIKLVSLDEFFEDRNERIDFIKIDVEGFEHEVLKGARNIIDGFRPAIYIELSCEYLDSSLQCIEFLKASNYIFTIEPDPHTTPPGKNFLAVHRTKIIEK